VDAAVWVGLVHWFLVEWYQQGSGGNGNQQGYLYFMDVDLVFE
jgi:hypothetical protein